MSDNEHLPILSSVVLLRLIDYAKRPVAEQARLNAQLDTVLSMLLPDVADKTCIVLSGAGSAAVAFLNSPPAALTFAECALRANEIGLNLCIGIDHGPVEVVSHEAGDMLAGDGVATASVIAAFSTKPGLLASQNFRTALAQMSPGAETALVPTANFSDAGLRTYKVFCLDPLAAGRRKRRLVIVATTLVILLLASATAIRFGMPDRPKPLAPLFETPLITIGTPECPKVVAPECPKPEPAKRAPHGNFWKNW